GQEQPRCLVDLAFHLRGAGHHAVAADLHGRCAARCARPAQGRPMTAPVARGELLLEVRELRVAFGAVQAVDGVDLSVRAGEKFALVGESGSGKSVTALSVLRLLETAQISGSIRFAGEELLQKSEREMR